MSQCQILTYDTTVFPPIQVYVPVSQTYYDNEINLMVVDNTPINPTDMVNKAYVDSLNLNKVQCIGSDVSPIVSGSSFTNFQSFVLGANSLVNPGDKIVYSSNINITSADSLQFEFAGNILETYIAGGVLTSQSAKVTFEINYITASTGTFFITVLSNLGVYAIGGAISSVDWTSEITVQTNGKDNSLTGTFTSFLANMTFYPG